MKKLPEKITVCSLDVLLMPQGEIIHRGKTLGWFKEMRGYLTVKTCIKNPAELLEVCKKWITYMDSDLSEAEQRLVLITKHAITKAED